MNKMIAIAGTNYDPKKTSLTALRMTTYIPAELLSAVMKEHFFYYLTVKLPRKN